MTEERFSPLHQRHLDAGASFTDFAGWMMPVRYSSDLAEHHAVRTAAGLFDLSHMGEILVLGPEASDALDYALAGKLSVIEIGQAKYSLLLSREGGIVDDLVVYRTGDDRYLVVANASNREAVAAELRDRCAPFACEVQDESDDIALIAVQGPRALEIQVGWTTAGRPTLILEERKIIAPRLRAAGSTPSNGRWRKSLREGMRWRRSIGRTSARTANPISKAGCNRFSRNFRRATRTSAASPLGPGA